jgi:hypothetical protein
VTINCDDDADATCANGKDTRVRSGYSGRRSGCGLWKRRNDHTSGRNDYRSDATDDHDDHDDHDHDDCDAPATSSQAACHSSAYQGIAYHGFYDADVDHHQH